MAIKNLVDEALKKPMSRKEFLGQIGAVLLAVIGVTSILHALGGGNKTLGGVSNAIEGYGTSVYGGRK